MTKPVCDGGTLQGRRLAGDRRDECCGFGRLRVSKGATRRSGRPENPWARAFLQARQRGVGRWAPNPRPVRSGQVNAAYTSDDHAFRENDPYARAKYHLTLRWISPHIASGQTLYNIGVGGGYFNHLAAARGLRVIGCEPDPVAYAAAARTAPDGVELINCGLERFAQDREPAQFVVMHDVLEHVADDAAAAYALRSLVAPGGRAVLSVPALMSLFGLHDEALGHYRRYTARTLRRVLEPNFVIRRLRWYGMASIPIAYYYSRLRRVPYPMGATSNSPLGTVYAKVCALESHIPEPLGTSLIAEMEARG